MLVLSRKKDESIVINNDITIVVVEIRGDKVRLGVEAPKEVPVHRREVFEAIARGEPPARRPPSISQPPARPTNLLRPASDRRPAVDFQRPPSKPLRPTRLAGRLSDGFSPWHRVASIRHGPIV